MSSLDYKIKKAAQGTAPHPAILLLHGYGSNADDLFTFADYLPEQYTIISLEAYHNVLAFASHGTQDATVPFAWAASGVKTLQKNNTGVTFNTYPEGHNVSPENFRDLLNWLKITDQD